MAASSFFCPAEEDERSLCDYIHPASFIIREEMANWLLANWPAGKTDDFT